MNLNENDASVEFFDQSYPDNFLTSDEIELPSNFETNIPGFYQNERTEFIEFQEGIISHDVDMDGNDEIYTWSRAGLSILENTGEEIVQTGFHGLSYISVGQIDIDHDDYDEIVFLGSKPLSLNDMPNDCNNLFQCDVPTRFLVVIDNNEIKTVPLTDEITIYANHELRNIDDKSYIFEYSTNKLSVFQINNDLTQVFIDSISIVDFNSLIINDYDQDGISDIIISNDIITIYNLISDSLVPVKEITIPYMNQIKMKLSDIFGNNTDRLVIYGFNDEKDAFLEYFDLESKRNNLFNYSGAYAFVETDFVVGQFFNISSAQILIFDRIDYKIIFYNETGNDWYKQPVYTSYSLMSFIYTYNVRVFDVISHSFNNSDYLLYLPKSDFNFLGVFLKDYTTSNSISYYFNEYYSLAFPMDQTSTIFADINGDGIKELITGYKAGQFDVRMLNENSEFEVIYRDQFSTSSVRSSGTNPTIVNTLSRDNENLILVTHGSDFNIYKYENNSIILNSSTNIGSIFGDWSRIISAMKPINIDAQGVDEIAVHTAQHGSDMGSVAVINVTSSGVELLLHEYLTSDLFFWNSNDIEIFDFDGDGYDDIISFGQTDDYQVKLSVVQNNQGEIAYISEEFVSEPIPNFMYGLLGDSLQTIITSDFNGVLVTTQYFYNNENQKFYTYSYNGTTHNFDPISISEELDSYHKFVFAGEYLGEIVILASKYDQGYITNALTLSFDNILGVDGKLLGILPVSSAFTELKFPSFHSIGNEHYLTTSVYNIEVLRLQNISLSINVENNILTFSSKGNLEYSYLHLMDVNHPTQITITMLDGKYIISEEFQLQSGIYYEYKMFNGYRYTGFTFTYQNGNTTDDTETTTNPTDTDIGPTNPVPGFELLYIISIFSIIIIRKKSLPK
jgi:hypothetical protein